MQNQQELTDLAEIFISLEKSISSYYQLCKEKIPEYKESWETLIKQENHHAEIFATVKKSLEETPFLWTKGKFQFQTVKLVVEDLQKKTMQFSAGEMNKNYALNYIMDVENSLLETEIIKAFLTTDKDMQILLNQVQDETTNHKNLLRSIATKR